MYRFRDRASYLSKFANFDLPHLLLALPWGVIPVEFRKEFWHQKTRVPGLSCGVVCVILRLAGLVEHRLVTDIQTHRQTDRHRAMTYSSRGKNDGPKHMLKCYWAGSLSPEIIVILFTQALPTLLKKIILPHVVLFVVPVPVR